MQRPLNYTPHSINVFGPSDGHDLDEFPSIGSCRVETISEMLEDSKLGAIPVYSCPTYGAVDWKPEAPPQGAAVIVSIVAAPQVAAERPDLTVYIPNHAPGQVVRDPDGNIQGVRSMILWHAPPDPVATISVSSITGDDIDDPLVDELKKMGAGPSSRWCDNGKHHLVLAIGPNPCGEPGDTLHLAEAPTLAMARQDVRERWAPAIIAKARELDVDIPWKNVCICHGNQLPENWEPIQVEAS